MKAARLKKIAMEQKEKQAIVHRSRRRGDEAVGSGATSSSADARQKIAVLERKIKEAKSSAAKHGLKKQLAAAKAVLLRQERQAAQRRREGEAMRAQAQRADEDERRRMEEEVDARPPPPHDEQQHHYYQPEPRGDPGLDRSFEDALFLEERARGFHTAAPAPHSRPMDTPPHVHYDKDSLDSEMQHAMGGGGMYNGAPQFQSQWQPSGSHGMGISRRGAHQTAAASAPFANDYSWQFDT